MHPGDPIIDQWASWLALDAPRRVSPATIRECCRHPARGVRLTSTPIATRLGESGT
jgi:hypothetical protein